MEVKSLLEKTFSSLPVLRIYTKDIFFLIPPGLAEFDLNIALLDEICYHYQDDLEKNHHLLEIFPPPDINEFDRFKIRETWRIGSFIVFALNIELTLKRRFEELLSLMGKFDPVLPNLYNNRVQERQQEIKKYKFYRNKIFAHTAFGDPKPKDNLSMQATSLAYFNGTIVGITQEGIRLGGMSVNVEEQLPPKFDSFTFPEMKSDFSKHFLDWYEMYRSICAILQKLTDEEIKRYFEGVVMIRRLANADEQAAFGQ